ncbi:hypothetical protein GF323_06765 [Candidatus Woesearchaeota archaeon]|nr:hypothetical protein [Candidatus Woesearchaeota archaeon]
MPLSKLKVINFYSRKEIQQAIVEAAENREIAIRFSEGFGKRPDILQYPEEVLDLARKGATSFHASEELWENPRLISSNMKRSEAQKLRKGWDLILDIDSPYWQIAKITAWLIIEALKSFDIASFSVKFSGNKGFHIGLPFETFPRKYNGTEVKSMFPDAPRSIALFILEHIAEKYIEVKKNNEIVFGSSLERRFRIPCQKLQELTKKSLEELTKKVCSKCGKELQDVNAEKQYEFICPRCESSIKSAEDDPYQICPKCSIHMEKKETINNSVCSCGSKEYFTKFNPFSIIEVDTILISSRHLFRMPYSMHEKSGLVSLPFNPEKILLFEKKYAKPEIVKVSRHKFIDRGKAMPDEAKLLLEKSIRFAESRKEYEETGSRKEFKALEEAIPEILFPPCIKKILNGMEDGRKRAVFILINFLKCIGWNYDDIEKRIREWNKKNPEPLKETIITGQLRYHKRNKDRILPPNCSNKMYYKDMQVCMPDNFCKKIKNPVNYAILKSKMLSGKK